VKNRSDRSEKSLIEQLLRARSAIVTGEYAKLPAITESIGQQIHAIDGNSPIGSRENLEKIRDLAEANAKITDFALKGVRTAIADTQMVRQQAQDLATYTESGTISHVLLHQTRNDRRS